MTINNAVIGVGSNIMPEENVILAEKELKSLGILKKKSNFIYTKPLVFEAQDDFLNGIFYLETFYEPLDLKKKLKEIEQKLGRIRQSNKNAPRTIDLDIVLFNNQIIDADVFERYFLKNPIIEMFPYLEAVIQSSNYRNNFLEVSQVIETIKSVLPNLPIAILCAENWFTEKENFNEPIDIIVITNTIDNKYQEEINSQLKNTITNLIVKMSLLSVEIKNEKYEKNDLLANIENKYPAFFEQFSFYKILYGKYFSKKKLKNDY